MDTSRRTFVGLTAGAVALAGGVQAAAAATIDPLKNRARFWIAALSPIDGKGNFDTGANDACMAYWKSQGADGVLLLGTTGEGQAFSVAERKKALEAAAKNKHGLDFIVGTGAANINDTIELSRHAADHGADTVLIVPPYYDKNPAGAGVVAYFDQVFAQVKSPIRYYHIPRTTGVPVDAAVFKALTKYPNFVGVKDSNGDAAEFETITSTLPGLSVMTGTDNLLEASLKHGNGCILASGNVFTKQIADVFKAYRAGADIQPALKRKADAQAILRSALGGGNGGGGAAVNKYVVSLLAGAGGPGVRAPTLQIAEALKPKLRAAVDQLKASA